jgi:hypothetical protein
MVLVLPFQNCVNVYFEKSLKHWNCQSLNTEPLESLFQSISLIKRSGTQLRYLRCLLDFKAAITDGMREILDTRHWSQINFFYWSCERRLLSEMFGVCLVSLRLKCLLTLLKIQGLILCHSLTLSFIEHWINNKIRNFPQTEISDDIFHSITDLRLLRKMFLSICYKMNSDEKTDFIMSFSNFSISSEFKPIFFSKS